MSAAEYAEKAEQYIAEACRPGFSQQIIDNCLKTAGIYATLALAAATASTTSMSENDKPVTPPKPWSSEKEVGATEARDKLLGKIRSD